MLSGSMLTSSHERDWLRTIMYERHDSRPSAEV